MAKNSGNADGLSPILVRLLFCAGLLFAISISLLNREWTISNLLKTIYIGAVWLVVGIFIIIGALYYRFAARKLSSMRSRRAFVYLYISGILLMSFVGIASLGSVVLHGNWSQMFQPFLFIGVAYYNAFVLLPPMWRELKQQPGPEEQ